MREIETKILGFNEKNLRKELKSKKAAYLGKKHYRRYVFDMAPRTIMKDYDEFVRLRTDGKKSTLTYKYRKGKGWDNTLELEVGVDNFENTAKIISKMCKDNQYKQENYVESWNYKNTEITISTWPLIPKFLEIEGKSEKAIKNTIKELKITGDIVGNLSYAKLYQMYKHAGKDQGDLKF